MGLVDYLVKPALSIRNAAGNESRVTNVAGTPEGVVTAGIGSVAMDITNGFFYVKRSGTSNTGWQLLADDGSASSEDAFQNTYMGKSGTGSENPTYSATNVVAQSSSLETAVGALDAEYAEVFSFIGKSGSGSEDPTYSSVVVVTQNVSLEAAIGELDAGMLPLAGGTMAGAIAMGSSKITGLANGTDAGDAVNKGHLDSAISGITWKDPVSTKDYFANLTIANIDGLTPNLGDTVVATDAGTPSAGTSDALTAGSVAEYNGTEWKEILAGVGGFVPDTTRLLVSTSTAITSPLTSSTDEGKFAIFDGTTNTPTFTTPTDGFAVLVAGETSVNENTQWIFDGTVPSGSWIQFGGSQVVTAGAGLSFSGNTLNVGDAARGVQVNADDLEIDASEIASTGLEQSTNSWQLRLATQGNGIAGGNGSTLSVQSDTTGGANLGSVIDVNSNGVAIRVDDSTIEDDGNGGTARLRVATGGIGENELDNQDGAVDAESFVLTSGWTAANGTVAQGDTIEAAIEFLAGNQVDLTTLSGVAQGSTNLGTFTGGLLSDTETIKSALQTLETEVERSYLRTGSVAVAAATITTVDSFTASSVEGVIWELVVEENSDDGIRYKTRIEVTTNGTVVNHNESGIIETGAPGTITVDVDIDTGNLRLRVTSTNAAEAFATRLTVI